jgi:hypothetical protein
MLCCNVDDCLTSKYDSIRRLQWWEWTCYNFVLSDRRSFDWTPTADRDRTPVQELPRSDTSGVQYRHVEGHQQYLRGTFERLNPIAGYGMPTKERRSRQ